MDVPSRLGQGKMIMDVSGVGIEVNGFRCLQRRQPGSFQKCDAKVKVRIGIIRSIARLREMDAGLFGLSRAKPTPRLLSA